MAGSSKAWDSIVATVLATYLTANLYQGIYPPLRLMTTVGIALSLLVACLELIRNPQRSKVIFLPLALLATFIPGALATPTNAYAHTKSLGVFTLIAVALLSPTIVLSSTRRLRFFLVALAAIGAGIAVVLAAAPDTSYLVGGRRSIVGANPIAVGRIIGLSGLLALTTWLFLQRRGRRRLLLLTTAIVLLLGALTTGTRAVLVAVTAGVVFIHWVHPYGARVSRARDTFVAMFCLFALTYGAIALNVSAVVRSQSGDTATRLRLAQSSWEIVQQHPTGIGWGNLLAYLPNGVPLGAQFDDQYSHNVLLEILAEGGWLAGAAFVLLTSVALLRSRGATREIEISMISGALVYAVVSALFSSNILGNRLMWGLLGAALAASSAAMQPRTGGSIERTRAPSEH